MYTFKTIEPEPTCPACGQSPDAHGAGCSIGLRKRLRDAFVLATLAEQELAALPADAAERARALVTRLREHVAGGPEGLLDGWYDIDMTRGQNSSLGDEENE